jgi:hypothetical protein
LDLQGDEQDGDGTPEEQDDEPGDTRVEIHVSSGPQRTGMDEAVARGQLLQNNELAEFGRQLRDWLEPQKEGVRKNPLMYVLLDDIMSGDARLVGLYASYMNYPIVYLIDETKKDKRDFAEEYLEQLGVPLFKAVVPNAHQFYRDVDLQKFGVPKDGSSDKKEKNIPGVKGVGITDYVAKFLADDSNHPRISRESFLAHVRDKLGADSVPPGLQDLARESRPVLVVWTKSNVTDLHRGKPEHLLGNTGTAQVLELARSHGFATAIAGDLPLKDSHRDKIDYDLRFVESGALAGKSLVEQYQTLESVSRTAQLTHIGMRSGNIEPLPVLGMQTIYLEEVANQQALRMQKLANASRGKYRRHQFLLPPTIKGQFHEAGQYMLDYKLRTELDANAEARVVTDRLREVLKEDLLQLDPGKELDFKDLKNADDRKVQARAANHDGLRQTLDEYKARVPKDQQPRGFLKEDLDALSELMKDLMFEAVMGRLTEAHTNVMSVLAAIDMLPTPGGGTPAS